MPLVAHGLDGGQQQIRQAWAEKGIVPVPGLVGGGVVGGLGVVDVSNALHES